MKAIIGRGTHQTPVYIINHSQCMTLDDASCIFNDIKCTLARSPVLLVGKLGNRTLGVSYGLQIAIMLWTVHNNKNASQ